MIATFENPSLHAKAAQSKGLLLWIEHLFEKHLPDFNRLRDATMARQGKQLYEAAVSAVRVETAFATSSRVLSRQEVQTSLNAYLRFLRFYSDAGGPLHPKHHFMLHLLQRSVYKGNPRMYTTYRDETFNGMLAKIARSCHRRTWMNIVHWKCQALHNKAHKAACASKLFS